MAEPSGAPTCDWPGCDRPSLHALPIVAGITMKLGGIEFQGSTFHVCADHAPRTTEVFVEALQKAERWHQARVNLGLTNRPDELWHLVMDALERHPPASS